MLDLYGYCTPNCEKVLLSILEMKLPFSYHEVDLLTGEQNSPEFLNINPFGKVPVIFDRVANQTVRESNVILKYLAKRYGSLFIGKESEIEIDEWMYTQASFLAPNWSTCFFFQEVEGHEQYSKRYLGYIQYFLELMDRRMKGREWLCKDYSIADMSLFPHVRACTHFVTDFAERFSHLQKWLTRLAARKAVVEMRQVFGRDAMLCFERNSEEVRQVYRSSSDRTR